MRRPPSSAVPGAGQGEEHLVQAGQVQGQLGDARCRRRRAGRPPRPAPSSPSTGTLSTPRPGRVRGRAGELAEDRRDLVEPGRVGRPHGQRLAADHPLEAVRGVVGDDPAVVDHGDLVGQRVGLVQVLGRQQHGRAVGRPGCGRRPTCPRAWPGRGRWSARRGRSRRAARPARRPGRGAAACRRSRSWPAGRRPRSGRTTSSSSVARARASRVDRSSSWPISTRFCMPVRSSSTEAYWPVRPIVCADLARLARRRRTRRPGRCPRRRWSRVARMRTAVVLPAPFGSEHAEHGAVAGRRRSTPARAWVSPKRLVRPSPRLRNPSSILSSITSIGIGPGIRRTRR